mmetsp:Transcript_5271/g.16952  ORF Transcript_5271/g.16952 Transcript_5271/m.16952 type:complete len:99 (-) Transcript_5271:787-1083(-)
MRLLFVVTLFCTVCLCEREREKEREREATVSLFPFHPLLTFAAMACCQSASSLCHLVQSTKNFGLLIDCDTLVAARAQRRRDRACRPPVAASMRDTMP